MESMSACPLESDERIISWATQASTGDTNSLGNLYRHFSKKITHFIRSRVGGDRYLAEDLHSQLWIRVTRTISQFDAALGTFSSWLHLIARNLITDHFRKPSTWRESLAVADSCVIDLTTDRTVQEVGLEEHVEQVEIQKAIGGLVQRLPERQQECLRLRTYHGLTVAETADMMGSTAGAVKMLHQRALTNLGKNMRAPYWREFAGS